jgi:thiamine transport system ATP-binding protein
MLQIHDAKKQFNETAVLYDVSLTVKAGEIVCLLGESGSGKTTLLRAIAGLETLDLGDVLLDGESLHGKPTHRRPFGLMFQDFALFPHMTVAENIGFGLKMQGLVATDNIQRVQDMLDLVGLGGFGGRSVSELSGGERQRVALARSLAPRPRLLMLDEPLGSLDAALRDRLVTELRTIIKQVGLTALYVTHDQQEAFAIADRVAVIHNGHLAQIATPPDLYHAPKTRYVAEFLGFQNFVAVEAIYAEQVDTAIGRLPTPTRHSDTLLLHPSGLSLAANGPISGTITQSVFIGRTNRLTVQHHSGVNLTFEARAQPGVSQAVGDQVRVNIEDWAIQGIQS